MSNFIRDKHLLFIMAEEQKKMQVELAQEETKKKRSRSNNKR